MNSFVFLILLIYLCTRTYAGACDKMAGERTTYTRGDGKTYVGCKGTLAAVATATTASACATGELAVWINEAAGVTSIYDFVLSTGENANGFKFNANIEAQEISGTKLNIDSLQCVKCIKEDSISANTISLSKMKSNSVDSTKIVDGTIMDKDIASSAISNRHLASGISGAKIQDRTITKDKLADVAKLFTMPYNINAGGSIHAGYHLLAGPGNTFAVWNRWYYRGHAGWSADVQVNGHMRIRGYGIGFSDVGMSYTLSYLSSYNRYTARDAIWGNYYRLSLWTDRSIMSKTFVGASDRRIKKNITSIPDNTSLAIIRKLDTKYYNYIDAVSRGRNRTIGFIAQDVREHIPEAVSIMTNFIPNEMRVIRPVWRQLPNGNFTTTIDDLKSKEPGKYRVMIDVTTNGTTSEIESEWTTGISGKTFESETPHEEIFLYGREVDDFHAIDKQKIFAVAYSALQQVDKIQQTLIEKVTTLENTIASLSERLALLEAQR